MMEITDWYGKSLRIAIGTDHGGFALKSGLSAFLESRKCTVIDCGPFVADSGDDYPDFGAPAAQAVARGEADVAILICRSGVGMGMVANRFHGVRAVCACSAEVAKKSREHNCSNVLVLPGDALDAAAMEQVVDAWLTTPFSKDERHIRRLVKVERRTYDDIAAVRAADPEVARIIDCEAERQADGIELIASENFASCAVRAAQGSVLTNKYAEGYPGKRYYNGCEFVDEMESLAIERVKKLFGAEAANVQPHSGSSANQAVYMALINPGDTVLAMSLDHGGHLTHGHPLNFSGMLYNIVPYGVDRETERIDYDEVERLAVENKPKMILAGASAYPRIIDFARLREIADKVGAKLFVDMAHIAGLVAAGEHPNPVPYCDVVTTTTHKTLRGPRGGLILCREEYIKAQGVSASGETQCREALAGACEPRIPHRLGRHRQPFDADRPAPEKGDRESRRERARSRADHLQQEHDPVRSGETVRHERHPGGDPGGHDPRAQGAGDGPHRRLHRTRRGHA